jgi:hypothetical protein
MQAIAAAAAAAAAEPRLHSRAHVRIDIASLRKTMELGDEVG